MVEGQEPYYTSTQEVTNVEQNDRRISMALRARVPVIAIETSEEDRILELMRELAVNPRFPDPCRVSDKTRPIFTWSISQGVRLLAGPEPSAGHTEQELAKMTDPIAALKWILDAWGEDKRSDPAIFVLLDPVPYLKNAQYARLVRDAAMALKTRKQNLILVAPYLDLPVDLRADVTVLDYPRPTIPELLELVEVKADAMEDHGIEVAVNDGGLVDVARALAGMTTAQAEQAIRMAIVATGHFADDCIPLMLADKAAMMAASGALEYFHGQAAWRDIGGLNLLKDYACRAMRSLEPAAREFGVDRRRGILLVGLPGCGKSLTAKAIAGGRMPLIRLDVGALFGELMGQSERQAREALAIIDAVGNCVVWIDEIEKALATGHLDGASSTRQAVLGTLLTWMEETTGNSFIVATANDIGALRPELIRRFDAVFFIDLPNGDERREILAIHLAKRNRNPDHFDLDALIEPTQDLTGAEVEQVVKEALACAYHDGEDDITTEDLVREAGNVVPLLNTMAEEMARMREWATRARAASSGQTVGIGAKLTAEEVMEL
jgi:hypothetical protein